MLANLLPIVQLLIKDILQKIVLTLSSNIFTNKNKMFTQKTYENI